MTPTAEQQAIIDAQDGVLLVFAAVGSGKTSTIARRMARAIQDGADPRRLLALTFTNRAAEHLRASVAREVEGSAARDVAISTFHGLCVRILRADAPRAGLPREFRILDEEDSGDLLRELGARAPVRILQRLRADAEKVPLGEARFALWNSGRFTTERLGAEYVRALSDRGAVDFAGLVFLARALLAEVEDCRERWAARFDHVVVDEVQDTHPTEAEVTLALAARARSLCLVGDLDQTIYGWRQASPRKLIERVTAQCQAWGRPLVELPLTRSFRSSRRLLAAADRVAAGLDRRATTVVSGDGVPEGVDPVIHAADHEADAHAAVAAACRAAIADGRPPRRIAVLVRTNQAVTAVARAFAAAGVPHATIDQFRFFRRPEIKDATALATLVLDRADDVSAHRVVQRLVQGVSPEDVYRVARDGRAIGLRLTDLLDTASVERGDPLSVLELPEVVVLDTETTGLSPDADEVIEVAAARLRAGQFPDEPADRFEALVRNTVPVGDSEHVHHLSDAKLRAVGRGAAQVFAELAAFIGDRPVAGHNVRFDLEMLAGHGARIGVPLVLPLAYDTLPLARRLVRESPDFRLGTLIKTLGIEFKATHRALDDVLATVALAQKLVVLARAHAAERRSLVATMAPRLERLRRTLDRWAAEPLRPPELLARIVDEALRKKYPRQPERVEALGTLVQAVPPLDDPSLPPRRALRHVLDRMALLRDLDSLDADLEVVPGVRIMTVHQAKGLEFDEVHVVGLVEGTFPLSSSSGDPDQREEERRLLYVAMTRARERLHLTYWKRDVDGQAVRPSTFLTPLLQR